MSALKDAGARVLIIGTGRHVTGTGLESLPAVERSVRDVGEVLVERCGLARGSAPDCAQRRHPHRNRDCTRGRGR